MYANVSCTNNLAGESFLLQREFKRRTEKEDGARGSPKRSMDRTGRSSIGWLCWPVWRSTMGLHSKGFRFEGGGRQIIGLNRSGKSCRLRWVNYLHPGLKRGKMTPHEERLVLELHSKWGNRWSRIARKLPGRTDNEIKNYWRTHMRKKAQERKQAMSPTSSSSNCSSSPSTDTKVDSETGEERYYDTGGPVPVKPTSIRKKSEKVDECEQVYSMDDIWKDIALSEEITIKPVYDGHSEQGCSFSCHPMASPAWEYSSDWLWRMDEEECKVFLPISDQLSFWYDNGRASLAG